MTDRTLSLSYGDPNIMVASRISASTDETRSLVPIRVGNKILLAYPDQLGRWIDESDALLLAEFESWEAASDEDIANVNLR